MKPCDMAEPTVKADTNSISEGNITAFCKLFADMVTQHLCELRREELNRKGGFSCENCAGAPLLRITAVR